MIRGVCFCRRTSYVRRGDRFFPGTLFQDRHRRPNGRPAGKTFLLFFCFQTKHLLLTISVCCKRFVFHRMTSSWGIHPWTRPRSPRTLSTSLARNKTMNKHCKKPRQISMVHKKNSTPPSHITKSSAASRACSRRRSVRAPSRRALRRATCARRRAG